MISISGDNNLDILYHRNDKTNKYEVYGFRLFNYIDDEGSAVVKIQDIDAIISGLQKVKQDVEDFNRMGS